MQAFYFQSDMGETICPEAPNGLLIQTPEGTAEVTFLINEVDIQLGSTISFQAQPGGNMVVSALEGHVDVKAFGFTSTAMAGTFLTVPLGADGRAAGPPSLPQSYDMDTVAHLPVTGLERAIEVASPMAQDQLAALIARILGTNGDSDADGDGIADDVADDNGAAGGDDDTTPPGLANPDKFCDNPALGCDGPPGQGGDIPGQEKDKDKDK
jgi:hypothetical protein